MAARRFSDFKGSLEFAGLLENGTLSQVPEDTEGTDDDEFEKPRDLDTTQRKKGAMPSTQTAAKVDWDLTIPLIEGGQAILRVPIPVSEDDFDLLKGVIASNLEAMKKAIVRKPTSGDDGA